MGLYAGYRCLGLVCDGSQQTRPVLYRRGTANFVIAPVDSARSLQLYDIAKLHLRGATNLLAGQDGYVRAVAAANDVVYASVGTKIVVLKNMRVTKELVEHELDVDLLLMVGSFLVSVSAEERRLITWNAEGEVVSDLFFDANFAATAITHPQTYVNKVLIGGRDGRMQLWNLRTKKKVHEFKGFGKPITVLEPAPVLDVVGIGTSEGAIVLHNVRTDRTITEFIHRGEPPERGLESGISSIAFRTDGDETMVSSSLDGTLAVWDLNLRRLKTISHEVHPGGIASASFLPSEPILVTAGLLDNCIKVHVFDSSDGKPRVLRHRSGHSSPPTRIEFCGSDPRQMVSAGMDREVRLVSVIRDSQNRTFAQRGNGMSGTSKSRKRRKLAAGAEAGAPEVSSDKNRLPPVVALATGDTRRRDAEFANVITGHSGCGEAYLWRLDSGSLSDGILKPSAGENYAEVTCVHVSHCGNYGVVGSAAGRLDLYNLQSARHVGSYTREENRNAHHRRVGGIAGDGCGDLIVSVGEGDRTMRFWDLRSRGLQYSVSLPAGGLGVRWSRTSDLVAVNADDLGVRRARRGDRHMSSTDLLRPQIYVYDAETRNLARSLRGHVAAITDIAFSGYGRYVVSASMDSTIRTWDLPSGRCVDVLSCSTAPVSLALSPDSAFVASVHVGSLGIALWVNKAHFDQLSVTGSVGADGDGFVGYDGWEDVEPESSQEQTGAPSGPTVPPTESDDPLEPHLATLSKLPPSQWTSLSNLDAIKARNKPQEPVRKPDNAPFFLPTTSEVAPQFKLDVSAEDRGEKKNGMDLDSFGLGIFGGLIVKGQFEEAAEYLNSLPPSSTDFELRCLDSAKGRRQAALYFCERLKHRRTFELTQAQMGVFLRVHGVELAEDAEGVGLLEGLRRAHAETWTKLRHSFAGVLSLTSFLGGLQAR